MDPALFIGCLILAILVVGVGILVSAIRIVPQFQRVVVFRFGSCIGQKGPGVVLLFPFGIDRSPWTCARKCAKCRTRRTSPKTTPPSASTS